MNNIILLFIDSCILLLPNIDKIITEVNSENHNVNCDVKTDKNEILEFLLIVK